MRLILASAAAAAALSACGQTDELPAQSCAGFPDALRACEARQCQEHHPYDPEFRIDHVILGEVGGRCVYSQSLPGDMRMECRFTPEGRAFQADAMQAFHEGELDESEPRAEEMDNPVTRECVVYDADGREMSWGETEEL